LRRGIAAREKDVGAFVALDLDAARRAADAPGLAALPLHGVPVAFKDIFATADLPTQYGSPIYPVTGRRRTPPRWRSPAAPAVS